MIVGSFVLHLYCDSPIHKDLPYDQRQKTGPAQFSASSGRSAFREARKCGWRIKQKIDMAHCPYCRAQMKK